MSMFERFAHLNPARVFLPGAVAFEVGPGLEGKRALLVASESVFGDPAWRIVRPAVFFRDGFQVWSGLERVRRLLARDNQEEPGMSVSQALQLFPIWEEWKPMNLDVQVLEVDILPRSLDKTYIPRIAERYGLIIEWTSKSHPLRVLGLPAVLEWPELLLRCEVTKHRCFRELRSLLKNGLPTEEPADEFGILRRVKVGAVPMRGERTDLMYATPSGARKLRFVRRFEGDPELARWFLRDAKSYEESERVDNGVVSRWVKGEVVYSPETLCKIVSVEGIKGMVTTLNMDVQVNGEYVDLLVDVRSVVSKGAHRLLEGEGPFWVFETLVGCTDHGSPMHREQAVSVRPEAALFAGLSDRIDPIEHLEPGLAHQLDELWRMAHQLGLDIR